MRMERLWGVFLTLVTDDHINYTVEGSKNPKFAYYDDKSFKKLFKLAITENRPMDILLERKQKGKAYDYVVQILRVGK